MALISSPIPNLVGGVSQQPPALRLTTTCERLENGWPSVVSGLLKRPPTEHVANVGMTISGGVAGYLIERNSTYRYMVVITNGDLKVIDLNDGSLQTISFPDGKTYLNASSPVDSFRFVTFGDYTFISNRNVVVGKTAVSEPVGGATRRNPAAEGTVYVSTSNANTYYTVYVNGVLKAQYLTPVGVDAATSVPDTATIAENLRVALVANGYTVEKTGSTLTITNLGVNDTLTVQGGTGDKSLKCFRKKVQSFSDLPPTSPEGRIVQVQGDVDEAGDDYYVVYRSGVWEETLAYGAGERLNPATMPHVLIRLGDGTWSFEQHVWEDRIVGDEDSNASPSFVGATINDIFVYTNRLGFLADENLILSEADVFENFYRKTTAQVIDSERIDLAVLHNNVDILRHAIAYNRDLLLMSNQNQFRFSYQNFLSAKNSQIRYSTSFNVSERIRPINMGLSVYFVDDRSDYTFAKLLEYYPKENVTADDADEVTASVPEYLPSDIGWMAGSNRTDCVLLSSTKEPTNLYFYKFYWGGDKKLQTSWSKWLFPDCTKLHWGTFSGTYLYLLVQRPTGLTLERVKFDEDVFDTTSNYELLLDRRTTSVSLSYDSVNDKTFIVTPWTTTSTNVEIVSTGGGLEGYRHTVTKHANNEFSVAGDISSHIVTVGIPYTFLFEFSPFYAKQAKGQGEVVILDARLQVRYVSLEYHDTAYFQTNLSLPGRDTFVATFNGRTVGGATSVLGQQSFRSGVYRIPVMGRNTDARLWLTNDSPFPSAFGAAEWQGELTLRSVKRI